MLFEILPFDLPVQTAHLLFGALIGLTFGVTAQITRFCLRRAVAGEGGADRQAGAVWLTALAAAISGFAVAQATGWVSVSEHRLLQSSVPVAAIVAGGLAFGAGMVLTRGCASRLTVLGASGNLRALTTLVVFAVVAHATIKGVLAPLRTSLGSVQFDFGIASLAEVPGLPYVIVIALIAAVVLLAKRVTLRARDMVLGAFIGALPVLAWAGTSVILADEFDPLPAQSLAFTLPWTDTLFWTLASTSIPAGFGVGLIGGVLLGAFVSAALRGEVELQAFESPIQTLRYTFGGALMGLGGVLAGGCTLGAGLSGGATLSVSALLALAAIVLGAVATRAVLENQGRVQAA